MIVVKSKNPIGCRRPDVITRINGITEYHYKFELEDIEQKRFHKPSELLVGK